MNTNNSKQAQAERQASTAAAAAAADTPSQEELVLDADVEEGVATAAAAAATTAGAATNGHSHSYSYGHSKLTNCTSHPHHQMLKSQIQLLEKQLLETRRLLHRQEQQQQQQANRTNYYCNNANVATTPVLCNGKAYYGALNFTNNRVHANERAPLLDHQQQQQQQHSSENKFSSLPTNTPNTSNIEDIHHNNEYLQQPQQEQPQPQEIPTEIRMTSNPSEYTQDDGDDSHNGNNTTITRHTLDTHRSGGTSFELLHHMFDDAVSLVRSEDDFNKEELNHECEIYLKSSILERAFPERQFALFVTLLFEMPVLFMISGGSGQICALIGRSKYQLLMAFLPLTSAISGNVGLQASTLTTRAISHNHVTASSYMPWFAKEIGASFCLALGMGTLMGSLSFYASGWDIAFALTIFVAQVISIVTAGCTGTIAPLLFSFIFRRDSGKWGGPLETAVQDIVGSFAMVVISYKILQLLGPLPVDPSDMCGSGAGGDV